MTREEAIAYGKRVIDLGLNDETQAFCDMAIKALEKEPKTGHWISVNTGKQSHTKDGMTVESVKCSECDEWLTASDEYACNGNYCPNCGAKMEEVEDA